MCTTLFRLEVHLLPLTDYVIPLTLTCWVNCSGLSSCGFEPHWLIRVRSDNYARHSLIRGASEEVLQEIQYTTTHGSNHKIVCGRNDSNYLATFNISFTSIGDHEEVLVTCGLDNTNDSSEHIQELAKWVALKQCE